jgi:glycosyltransferase involved in cell wall biosynthesis
MKLVVANSATPFVPGDAEMLADRLVLELNRAGHEAELLRIPQGNSPEQVLDSLVAAAALVVPSVDRVIGLRFPAYLIPHSDMVIWLVHQFRQDEPPPVGWPADRSLGPINEAIRTADRRAFAMANRIYAVSSVVADRLDKYTGSRPDILMPPPHTDRTYQTRDAEGFIVALGRVSPGRRQRLAIEAMRYAKPGYRLVVAGAADTPELGQELHRLVDDPKVGARVEYIDRSITDEEKLDLLARCSGSVYIPLNVECYGYSCYEAALSRKPTITGTDSGVGLELVEDGRTGLVAEPEPRALAKAFDEVALDPVRSRQLGEHAHRAALDLDLSWTRVIRELTR